MITVVLWLMVVCLVKNFGNVLSFKLGRHSALRCSGRSGAAAAFHSFSLDDSKSHSIEYTPDFRPYEKELSGFLNEEQLKKLEHVASMIYKWNFKTNLVCAVS